MTTNSQESTKGPAQKQKFSDEFTAIKSEIALRAYEEENRQRIANAKALEKFKFDEHWKEVIGQNYFQPTTTITPALPAFGVSNVERSNPRQRKYKTRLIFSKIFWQKLRRKLSGRWKDLYILSGIVKGKKDTRPIFQNLSPDRLKELLGEKTAYDIIDAGKKKDRGEISGSFPLDVEGYWEVQFSPKKDKNDPPDVRLSWEGITLIIQRMQEVVLPGYYIEVADNATKDHYIQNPKEGRKKIGVIQEYPYVVLREATREEYLAQKESGDKIMKDVRAKQEGA